MIITDLEKKNLINPPSWLESNVCYLTIMGSHAYGTADVTKKRISDFDVNGFCIPPKDIVFPHLAGEIPDFLPPKRKFDQFQQHHIFDPDALGGKGREYDFTIFNIVKYFKLLLENNPNIIDSIFTTQECVLHITAVGNLVRENRHMFLHKGCWPKFKGYTYSQLHKMKTKEPEGKRKEIRDEYGFDVKYGMHVVRLLSEAEMILVEGDLDLQRNREQLKCIRRGEMSEDEIRKWASEKESQLEKAYSESSLPAKPDEVRVKNLLLRCLEEHYGSLEKAIVAPDMYRTKLMEIKAILDSAGIH